VYDVVRAHASPERTTLVGSSLAMGALCAAEAHRYRMATVHLAPICVRSTHAMPVLPGGIDFNWLPMWARRKFWDGADKWFIDPIIVPKLNAFRAELSLPPVTRFQQGWWHAPMRTIGLWPDWFFPHQPDYPPQVRLSGFVQYDESDHVSLDADLVRFLDVGDPPIAFTPGSAMVFGHAFFRVAVDASTDAACSSPATPSRSPQTSRPPSNTFHSRRSDSCSRAAQPSSTTAASARPPRASRPACPCSSCP
jgi:rhamnosyltransferase subunit B